MGRPKSSHGVNKVCAQCTNNCKQSSDAELLLCPLFRATGADPTKLVKPVRRARHSRHTSSLVNHARLPMPGA